MYLPSLLDQYPPSTHSLYPPPPPQLSTCVLPAGVEFFSSGFDVNDESTFPRSYPIVLTGTVGTYPSLQEPLMQKMAQSWFMGGPSSNQKTTTITTTPSLLADWNSYASSSKEGGGAVFDLEAVVISVNDTVSGTFSVKHCGTTGEWYGTMKSITSHNPEIDVEGWKLNEKFRRLRCETHKR